MKNRMLRRAGFTLVEIMTVVAIIGLLEAIAIPNFVKPRTTSQMNVCINNLRQDWRRQAAKGAGNQAAEQRDTAAIGPRSVSWPGGKREQHRLSRGQCQHHVRHQSRHKRADQSADVPVCFRHPHACELRASARFTSQGPGPSPGPFLSFRTCSRGSFCQARRCFSWMGLRLSESDRCSWNVLHSPWLRWAWGVRAPIINVKIMAWTLLACSARSQQAMSERKPQCLTRLLSRSRRTLQQKGKLSYEEQNVP
jgi:prepilin-type N-terminal cleavage/methylation domain-containing protein